jgi:hypothetical protein
VTECFIKFI